MIANKSARSTISFVHLAISIFAFCIFFVFFWIDKNASFMRLVGSDDIFGIFILLFISFISLFGFVSWQSDTINTSKNTSYLLALLLCIEFFVIFIFMNQKNAQNFVPLAIITFIPALFVFLLAFSKIGQTQTNNFAHLENNDVLDLDFIPKQTQESNYFWTTNRIFSITCFTLSILIFFFITSLGVPILGIIIPCIFLIGSIILWIFPKVGSWIFAITSILVGICMPIGYIYFLTLEINSNNINKLLSFIFFFIGVLGLSLLCISLALLLLSKEAKEEWKK